MCIVDTPAMTAERVVANLALFSLDLVAAAKNQTDACEALQHLFVLVTGCHPSTAASLAVVLSDPLMVGLAHRPADAVARITGQVVQ